MTRLFVLLLLAAPVWAAEPPLAPVIKLVPGKSVKAEVGHKCIVVADTTAKRVTWKMPPGIESVNLDGKRVAIWASEGTYTLVAMVPNGDDVLSTEIILTVTGPRPPPVPPIPPQPPVPPEPPAPIPVAGLRVLIVYETGDLQKLPRSQLNILYAQSFRDLLLSKCVVGPDGVTKEFRIWDANTPVEAESKLWQDAMKRTRTAIPWLIVSNGKSGYDGPLPQTLDDAIALVKKFSE